MSKSKELYVFERMEKFSEVPTCPVVSVPILRNFQYCTFIYIFFIGNIFVAILRNFWAFHFVLSFNKRFFPMVIRDLQYITSISN